MFNFLENIIIAGQVVFLNIRSLLVSETMNVWCRGFLLHEMTADLMSLQSLTEESGSLSVSLDAFFKSSFNLFMYLLVSIWSSMSVVEYTNLEATYTHKAFKAQCKHFGCMLSRSMKGISMFYKDTLVNVMSIEIKLRRTLFLECVIDVCC